ncbi:MAG TPA: DUF1080 domain-containing protein [Flavobacterium sp.]|nr:DUF1080 domain-containing protein [Flavobacterium sp.]
MNPIYRLLLIILFLFSQNSNAQKRVALFNQKDLKGWYAFGEEKGKLNNAAELFSVENNMIRMYGPKAGYLISEQSFRNFKLTVEYRWNTDTKFAKKNNSKNSGVMYLVPSETPDVLWPKGIQFQIKEGATGDFVFLQEVTLNINGKKTEPGKSVVAKRFLDAEKAIGEWNKLVVTSKNGVITQKLNGKTVNKGIESSVTEGRILLQYEGFPIDFRKVNIKKCK